MFGFLRDIFSGTASFSFDDLIKGGADIVSCKANPRDLRPAVDGIIERVRRTKASLRDAQQPLVILIADTHIMPAHKVLPIIVTNQLLAEAESGNWGSVACGVELGHNTLGVILKHEIDPDLTCSEQAEISEVDHDGQKSLAAFLAFSPRMFAPVSHHTLLNFYRQQGLSICFTDVAGKLKGRKGWECALDLDIPATRDLIARHAPQQVGKTIMAEEPQGMRLRNIAMVERSMRHIKETGAKIYIHTVGREHFGSRQKKLSYEESLPAEFVRAGAKVINVLATDSFKDGGIDTLPADFSPAFQDSVIVTEMCDKFFYSADSKEAAFLHQLASQSEKNIPVFDAMRAQKHEVTQLQDYVRQQAPLWISEIRKSQP